MFNCWCTRVLLGSPLMCTLNHRTDKRSYDLQHVEVYSKKPIFKQQIWQRDALSLTWVSAQHAQILYRGTIYSALFIMCLLIQSSWGELLNGLRGGFAGSLADRSSWRSEEIFCFIPSMKIQRISSVSSPHTHFVWLQIVVELDLRSLSVSVHSTFRQIQPQKTLIWSGSSLVGGKRLPSLVVYCTLTLGTDGLWGSAIITTQQALLLPLYASIFKCAAFAVQTDLSTAWLALCFNSFELLLQWSCIFWSWLCQTGINPNTLLSC